MIHVFYMFVFIVKMGGIYMFVFIVKMENVAHSYQIVYTTHCLLHQTTQHFYSQIVQYSNTS